MQTPTEEFVDDWWASLFDVTRRDLWRAARRLGFQPWCTQLAIR